MQIHELNNFTGTLGSGAYLAIDDGTDTGKISSQGLLAATEARIDNIIAGPAPSAEEIVDARYGADGVTYPSLGDAIRDQVSDLKADINDNTDDISALQTAVANLGTHKVAQPLDENNQPTDGTDGQLLRTKGDGSTEWVDEGLPTNEQTAQAVSDWLDDHPEATTTVQDGSLTEAKFSGALKLKTIKDYVTPEMFGAVGDGVTDDTNAIQSAFNSSELILLSAVYKISSPLSVKSNSIIIGSGNTWINGGNHTILDVDSKNDITISDVHLSSISVEGSLNANIRIVESANVYINNCSFEKGCYGAYVYDCNNISIDKCLFSDFLVNDDTGNGGYAVLLESTKSTKINDCIFDKNINGKHAIYVSVHEDESGCEDTTITDCHFDNSLQTHKAPTTVPVNVRASINTTIAGCVFNHTSGCITLIGGNGDFVGIKICNNIFKNYEYASGAAETRARINIYNNSDPVSACDVAIENNVSLVDDGETRLNKEYFLNAYKASVYMSNNESKDGLYCNVDSCSININGFKTNSSDCAFRLGGVISGSEKDVEASSASKKFIFNNASARLDFFEPKDDRFFLRVRSDSFNNNVINKSYSITTSNKTIDGTLVHQVKFPFTLLGGVGAFQYNLSSKLFLQFLSSGEGDFNFACIDPSSTRLYPNMYVEFISIE